MTTFNTLWILMPAEVNSIQVLVKKNHYFKGT
uniref:Uncharacterized protein n=1 Tax=Lepeophtheirus salmonis TaxID=72036 RepID=A0A0K2TN70_LEPSM